MFSVDWQEMPRLTSVPDSFICNYMKDAPGEFVKLYLYLLMLSQKSGDDFSLDTVCQALSLAQEDVLAGLHYWEKKQLLELFYQGESVYAVRLRIQPLETVQKSHRLSQERIRSFVKENKDAGKLLFTAEKYFGRPLSPIEIGTLLYFMDELHFSFDLCDQLLQYCVERGHSSIRYIEKVALAWHEKGYTTAEEAKDASSNWSKIHFQVLRAFGIKNRNPVQKEIDYINRWYNVYCFSIDIIAEACAITLHRTGEQSFDYAEGILSRWHKEGVKSLSDIKKRNADYSSKEKKTGSAKTEGNKNQFLNFQQRDDDLDELAKKLDQQFANM